MVSPIFGESPKTVCNSLTGIFIFLVVKKVPTDYHVRVDMTYNIETLYQQLNYPFSIV